MAYIILPSRRTRQPQGVAPVTPAWQSALALLWEPWIDPLRSRQGAAFTKTGAPVMASCRQGRGLYFAANEYLLGPSNTSLILTSDGAGTGDFSLLVVDQTDTVVSANGRCLLSQRSAAATAYAQAAIHANKDGTGGDSPGTLTGWTYYAGYQSVVSTGAVDGAVHARMLVRRGTTLYLYQDGRFLASQGGSAMQITAADSQVGIGIGPPIYNAGSGSLILLAGGWNKGFSDAESAELTRNPWQLFAPDPRRLYFGASGGGATTTTINAETGAFALTGAAATLNRGLVPLDAQPTSYAVSGTAATLARGWNLDAQPGTFTVSGTAATLARGWNLDAQPSTFAVSGTDATLARGWNLDAQPGAFELTGIAATLEYVQPGATTLDVQPGVFAVSGAAATLTYVQLTHYVIDAQPGTFTLTGVPGTLTYNQLNAYEITASPGTFSVTGADAALTYTLASIWTDINPASSIWTDIDPNTIWTGL